MNEASICYIINKICAGLAYLMKNHIVHRTIMSKTILIDSQLNVKISGSRHMKKIEKHLFKSHFSLPSKLFEFPNHAENFMGWIAPEILDQVIQWVIEY